MRAHLGSTFMVRTTISQALVLLQFNGPANKPGPKLLASALQQKTQLSQSLLQSTLQTLLAENQSLLRQTATTGSSRKSQTDIIYELNEDFHFKSKGTLQLLTGDEEVLKINEEKQVEQAVNLDRKAYVESVLYKIMKKEKHMLKKQLLKTVHAGLIFPQEMAKVETCL